MGFEMGFDMVPLLTRGTIDKTRWNMMITEIQKHYQDDPNVDVTPTYLVFKAGDYPKLPFESHKFLCFKSQIKSDDDDGRPIGAQHYVHTIAKFAQEAFGPRIRKWNEFKRTYSVYDWRRMNESIRSYEQVIHH